MMLDIRELVRLLNTKTESATMEVRIGDVSEGDDLHCSIGKVVVRGGCVVLVPGDDDVWKDETVASNILSEQLWPEEEEEED